MNDKKTPFIITKNPKLITNFYLDNNSKLCSGSTLLQELVKEIEDESTTEISFAVSFIKNSGYKLLEKSIRKALKKKVIVKVITSIYLEFTEPVVLNSFLKLKKEFSNFDFRVLYAKKSGRGHHMKAYLFQKNGKEGTIFIGSSNISGAALESNLEWNIRYTLSYDNELYKEVHDSFNNLWNWSGAVEIDSLLFEEYNAHWNADSSTQARKKGFESENWGNESSSEDSNDLVAINNALYENNSIESIFNEQSLEKLDKNYRWREILKECRHIVDNNPPASLVSVEKLLSDGNAKLIKLSDHRKEELLSESLGIRETNISKRSLVYKFLKKCQSSSIGAFRFRSDLLIFKYLCDNKFNLEELNAKMLVPEFEHLMKNNTNIEEQCGKYIENFKKFFSRSNFIEPTDKSVLKFSAFPHQTSREEDILIEQNRKYFEHVYEKYYKFESDIKHLNKNLSLFKTYINSDVFYFHKGTRDNAMRGIENSEKTKGCFIMAIVGTGGIYENKITANRDEIIWCSPDTWTDSTEKQGLWSRFEEKDVDCDIFIRFKEEIYPNNLYWYIGKMKSWEVLDSSSVHPIYRIKLKEEIDEKLHTVIRMIIAKQQSR